jgi:hypothetical protein
MSSDQFTPAPHICTSSLHVLLQCLFNNMQLPLVVTPMDNGMQSTEEIECLLQEVSLLRDLYGELQLSVPCVSTCIQRGLLSVLLSELC